ncbi:MAG: hypothetical protein JWM09_794 [Francisellaceae bacterium]|nr:hypothetical protein [Francisellaceae bacterium]
MTYSTDLREKTIKYVEQGGSVKDACRIFDVSRSSFQRWQKRKKTLGSLKSKPRERTPYKVDNEQLKNYIAKHPDAYLNEIASHFKVTSPGILIALRRLKITRKKSPRFIKKETN